MTPDPDPGFSAPAYASGSDQPEKSQIWPFQDLYPEISFIIGTGPVLFYRPSDITEFYIKVEMRTVPVTIWYGPGIRYGTGLSPTFSCCSVSVGEITPADKPVKRISDVSMASRSSDGGSSGYLGG